MQECKLNLFAVRTPRNLDNLGLEARLKFFLSSNPETVCLDSDGSLGAERKADYLLYRGDMVAELKTINANPKTRISSRLKERLSKSDAPIAVGKVGLNQILEHLPDSEDMLSTLNDISMRSLRADLKSANSQISSTKNLLNLPNSRGLAILANDSVAEIQIGSAAIGVKRALENLTPQGEFSIQHIDYVWLTFRSHMIRLPDKSLGYPQLLIFSPRANLSEQAVTPLLSMILAWGECQNSETIYVPHDKTWNAFTPVFADGPPIFDLY